MIPDLADQVNMYRGSEKDPELEKPRKRLNFYGRYSSEVECP